MHKFNKKKDELLIEAVQGYSALYNKSDVKHTNIIYKHKCWEKISGIVGFPVSECKKRWRSLRDQYNKKMKELNSTWEYMNLMSFMSEGNTVNDSQTSIPIEEVNTGIDSECDNTRTTVVKIEVNTDLDSECDSELDSENGHTSRGNIDDTDALASGPSTSKKRKPNKLQETLDKRESRRLNSMEPEVNNTQKQSQIQPQSAIKKFFESMAEVVENFPPREQAIIRAKVCQLISDTEIKLSSNS